MSFAGKQAPFFIFKHFSRYTLNADAGKIIKITFDKFDVESEFLCEFDFLSINGRKHCGTEDKSFGNKKMPLESLYVLSESTELVWKTDGSVTKGGFSLSWESVDNPTGAAASGPLESAAGFHDHMEVKLRYDQKTQTSSTAVFSTRGGLIIPASKMYF